MVTGGGKVAEEEVCEREVVEEVDVVEEEPDDDTRVELENVEEREDVKEEPEVVKLVPDVEERPVVNDEFIEVGENIKHKLPEDVGLEVDEPGTLIEIDEEKEVEGSIVMVESKSEVGTLLSPVGKVVGEGISVRVNGSEIGSPKSNVSVFSVLVIGRKASVLVGSPVWVGVGVWMASKEASEGGVDIGMPVGVPDKAVGDTGLSLVENGGIGSVKLKRGKVRKAVSNPISSSLMEGVDKPQ